MDLAALHCRHLGKETPPLEGPAVAEHLARIDPAWRVDSGPVLVRRFASKEYPRLVQLAAKIGALAQAEDHHPDMALSYGKLEIALTTHSVGGLSLNDFVLAARIDRLAQESSF
jgi:4a-hydroxytetrahydrobiopterin dehydratase